MWSTRVRILSMSLSSSELSRSLTLVCPECWTNQPDMDLHKLFARSPSKNFIHAPLGRLLPSALNAMWQTQLAVPQCWLWQNWRPRCTAAAISVWPRVCTTYLHQSRRTCSAKHVALSSSRSRSISAFRWLAGSERIGERIFIALRGFWLGSQMAQSYTNHMLLRGRVDEWHELLMEACTWKKAK